MEQKNNYDSKGNATQYDDHRIATIVQMERIWGTKAVMIWCEITAFKYRSRLGKKDDIEQEMVKVNWYENMAKHLQNKLNTELEVFELSSERCKNPFRNE